MADEKRSKIFPGRDRGKPEVQEDPQSEALKPPTTGNRGAATYGSSSSKKKGYVGQHRPGKHEEKK